MLSKTHNEDLIYQIALGQIEGLGPVRQVKLIENFLSAKAICAASKNDLLSTGLLTQELADQIKSIGDASVHKKTYDKMIALGIQAVHFQDANYPERLKHIASFPVLLFYRGNLDCLHTPRSLGIVGTRQITNYGLKVTQEMVPALVHEGLVIVSGLAFGVDACAHKECLKAHGKTVAVLAQGVDRAYPRMNQDLFHEIVDEGGCVVSEFPFLTTSINPFCFPRRNRIISGLSDGLLVIEAGEKSGSLITARYAMEQNRNVYAIPGALNQKMSRGCLQIIRDGAKLVLSHADILDDFGLSRPQPNVTVSQTTADLFETPLEKAIFNLCRETPQPIDLIIDSVGEPASYVSATLTKMQLMGKLKDVGGKRFVVE